MADLEALIRLRKHSLDEKRRYLAQLYREEETLERQKKSIEDQMEEEKRLSIEMQTAEALAYYGRYAEGARAKIAFLDDATEKLNVRIDIAREDMREAFAEMKKIEITHRRRVEKEEEEERKKEDQELDDIAIENYRKHLEEQD
jgi:flagellar export protein FliJ